MMIIDKCTSNQSNKRNVAKHGDQQQPNLLKSGKIITITPGTITSLSYRYLRRLTIKKDNI